MTHLIIEAFGLDEEFEALILKDFAVRVKDRTKEPWSVVFEGPREGLIAMYNEHWADDNSDNYLAQDSSWLSDLPPEIKTS